MRVVIPYTDRNPKSRLAPVLSAAERRAFARAMLGDVVEAVRSAGHDPELLLPAPIDIADADADTTVGVDGVSTTVDDRALTPAVDAVLDHFDLAGQFEVTYGREPSIASLSRKKPSPYYIERALEDLGAETALFVGDNESDVLAADNAGIDSAFVRRPHRRSAELSCQPTYEIDDLHDLVSICGRAPVDAAVTDRS